MSLLMLLKIYRKKILDQVSYTRLLLADPKPLKAANLRKKKVVNAGRKGETILDYLRLFQATSLNYLW